MSTHLVLSHSFIVIIVTKPLSNSPYHTHQSGGHMTGVFNSGTISARTNTNHSSKLKQFIKNVTKNAALHPATPGNCSVNRATTMGPSMPAKAPMVLTTVFKTVEYTGAMSVNTQPRPH